jgi:hypothetical protein
MAVASSVNLDEFHAIFPFDRHRSSRLAFTHRFNQRRTSSALANGISMPQHLPKSSQFSLVFSRREVVTNVIMTYRMSTSFAPPTAVASRNRRFPR